MSPPPEEEARAVRRANLRRVLEARSVVLVGASTTPGSFGQRALVELERSPSPPEIHLVNPRRAGELVGGRRVLATLDDVDGPVDLVMLAVGDGHLEEALSRAAKRGDAGAVVFGNAVDAHADADADGLGAGGARGPSLRARLARIAADSGMALCGGGCMGFVSQTLRAIGYLEPAPLPKGPIALVTHSGSAFSALLRADRPFGWSLAVSSGQELVTTTSEYLEYALDAGETGVVALVLETLREPERLRAALSRASDEAVPVVALTVGASAAGRAMVTAHSGALAGSDGAWEALCDRHGVLRVRDLHELCDTVELVLAGRRAPSRGPGAAAHAGSPTHGIAAVLDSGAERALLADLAAECGVAFAHVGEATIEQLGAVLDPGLEPANPLDLWGRGRSTEAMFTQALVAFGEDPEVDAVALAVDLVPELDGDESYLSAAVAAWERTTVPMCVLSHVPSALDRTAARALRAQGIPVLEGTRSGLRALRNLGSLRDHADRPVRLDPRVDAVRRARWQERLRRGTRCTATCGFALLADYGIASLESVPVASAPEALAAADRLGFPVAMKTAEPEIAHKIDVAGVTLWLRSPEDVRVAYDDLHDRLGARAVVMPMAPEGIELSVGVVRDPLVGAVVVVGAGGTLVEVFADRAVGLPPLDRHDAARMVDRLRVRPLLDAHRGRAAVDMGAVLDAVEAMSAVATELGDVVRALEVNPLRCTADAAVALDVLVET